jgi:two-component system, chemotaxis family, response regulator Rcp1
MTQSMEILLVEDNEGDVEMTQRALQGRTPPCNLCVANNGMEALDYLFKRGDFQDAVTPQLILLDLNMPQMNGKEFLKIMKQNEQLKTIPVVVVTSSKAPSDILESYRHYANCYVVKPFNGEEFMGAIKLVVDFWRNSVLLPHEAAAL